jgi:hypothetical protein
MISTSQKEHLTYTLILQCAIILGVAILGWIYIIPWIEQIRAHEQSTQSVIDKYTTVKENWIAYENLGGILATMKGKEELIKIIRAAPEETKTVIRKSIKWDYREWLSLQIASSEEDKKKLSQAKQKINSILPTMSPISNSVDEEYITLKEYIRFIESNFLANFDIKSNIVLGIQWIDYPEEISNANVGTFELKLDFKATNTNIQKLITYVNESGNPEILSFSGILTEDRIPKILSNPLMTVEALALEDVLDGARPDATNNGRITIKFYIRGSSKEDITFLKWAIIARQESLQKKITVALDECKKQWLLCTELSRLEAFEKKFNEFVRSLSSAKGIETTDISILGQSATSLRTLDDEFESLTQKSNNRK